MFEHTVSMIATEHEDDNDAERAYKQVQKVMTEMEDEDWELVSTNFHVWNNAREFWLFWKRPTSS